MAMQLSKKVYFHCLGLLLPFFPYLQIKYKKNGQALNLPSQVVYTPQLDWDAQVANERHTLRRESTYSRVVYIVHNPLSLPCRFSPAPIVKRLYIA
jgi:hypothetical protein